MLSKLSPGSMKWSPWSGSACDIDEVRIPGVDAPADWRDYFHPALYGATDLLSPAVARTSQGLVEYVISERQRLVMRYGAAAEGGMVNPDGVFRLQTKDRGPYFLIDLDSFWLPPEEELPEFAAGMVMEICGELHAPVRTAFEAAVASRSGCPGETLRMMPIWRRRPEDRRHLFID